jgi:hypothetical protein
MLTQATAQTRAFAASALSALGSVGVAATLGGAFTAFSSFERQMVRLKAAVESNGAPVEATLVQYEKFAQAVSDNTLVTKVQTRAMLEQAEVQGFTGAAAEKVVANAIALAKGNGDLATSYIRVAVMMQRGHPEFARRILGLQGVNDQTELLAKINQRLGAGLKVANADMNTTGGQLQKLKVSLFELTLGVGETAADLLRPVIGQVQRFVEWFKQVDPAVKRVVVQVLFAAAAFVLLPRALSIVMGLLNPVVHLFRILAGAVLGAVAAAASYGLQAVLFTAWIGLQVLGLTLLALKWVAYSAVLIAARGAVLAWNIAAAGLQLALDAFVSVMGLASAATGFLATALTIAAATASAVAITVATLGLALAVLAAALAGAVLLGFAAVAAAAAVLAAAWTFLATLAAGLVGSMRAVGAALAGLGDADPLRAVTSALGEWWETLKLIARVLTVDVGLAWKLAAAGAALAVAQIRDLWPPLWELIRGGAEIAFDTVGVYMKNTFDLAVSRAKAAAAEITRGFGGDALADALQQAAALDEKIAEARNKRASEEAARRVSKLAEAVGGGEESAAVKAARATLKGVQDEANAALAAGGGRKAQEDLFKKFGAGVGSAFNKGVKEKMGKFDAADYFSAEAVTRVQHFAEQIGYAAEKAAGGAGAGLGGGAAVGGAGGHPLEAAPAGGAEAAGREQRQNDLLKRIAAATEAAAAKPGVQVQPAGLA